MKKTIKKTVSWLLSMVLLVGALFNVNVMPVRAAEAQYVVNFGDGSWNVGGTTVTASISEGETISGVQSIDENTEITLTNFDAATMEVRVYETREENPFNLELAVENNKTSLSKKQNGNLPSGTLEFRVQSKPSGGGQGGGTPSQTINLDFSDGTVAADGKSVTYTVKVDGVDETVTVTLPGYITLSDKKADFGMEDQLTLSGFDPDKMEFKVVASDGFSTSLAVIDNKTSLSNKTNEGGLRSPLTVNIVQKGSNPPPPGDGPSGGVDEEGYPVVTGDNILKIDILQDGYINSVKVDDVDARREGTKAALAVTNNSSHKFMFQFEFGKAASAISINGISYSGSQLVKGAEDWYTINDVPSSADGKYDVSIVETETSHSTIVWTYSKNHPDQTTFGPDALVEHGKVEIVSIKRGSDILYENGSYTAQNPEVNGVGVSISSETGYITLEKGDDIVIKLIPDYGYQLGSATINDRELQPKSEAFSDVSTFTLNDVQGQMHFSGVFKSVADSVSSTATSVSGASISNGANAASSGNLSLNVKDAAADSAALSAAMGSNTDSVYSSVATLDLTLDNVVSMGPGKGNWTKNITEFSSDITVGLNLSGVTVGADEELVVVRKHGSTYDVIEGAALNGSTLSVPTNKFSTYSIIKKQKSNEVKPSPSVTPSPSASPSPSNPSDSSSESSSTVNEPTAEPESTKVSVPVSGENTVSIEAVVSDGNATIGEISKQSISKLGNDDSVVIDVSSTGSSVKEVTLTKNTFETLTNAVNDATSKISSVEIKLPKATVEIDKAAMNAIKSFTGGKDVKVSVETKSTSSLNTAQKNAIADKKVMATFEANIESGGKKLHDFNGGTITVTVAFKPAAGTDSNYYHVEYVADDGRIERFPTKVTASGVEVTLPHFSSYVIVYDTTKANNTKSTAPKTCSPSLWYMLFRE